MLVGGASVLPISPPAAFVGQNDFFFNGQREDRERSMERREEREMKDLWLCIGMVRRVSVRIVHFKAPMISWEPRRRIKTKQS